MVLGQYNQAQYCTQKSTGLGEGCAIQNRARHYIRKESIQRVPVIFRPANALIATLRMGAGLAICLAFLSGCAFVPQVKREYLSDPIMQRQEDGLESALEGHDFPRREGSVGGSSGSGGGCGC